MAVDVHCNHGAAAVGGDSHGIAGDNLASYLGGALGGYGHGHAGDLGYGGLGHGLVDAGHHVGGIGLSEGELTGHSDLLNGLGGVNGMLSEQGVAKEHADSVGIPFGAGMGSDGDFAVHHGGIHHGLSVSSSSIIFQKLDQEFG